MRMKSLLLSVFAVLFVIATPGARAGGLIIVRDWTNLPPREVIVTGSQRMHPIPDMRWRFPLAPLEVASEKIDAKIKDQVATVSIEQEFYNPNARQLEGTFLFPIPKGAHLDKFKMEIAGRMVEPELLTAEKARRIYEDIVRAARDPALLEYEGRDCLKVRIFPIEPNSRKKIALTYTQLLKQDEGLLEFTLPISPQKYSAKPIEHLSLNLEIETTTPLKTVYSPSHAIELSRPQPRRAAVKLDERELSADKDFQLLYGFEKSEVALKVLTHRTGDEDGYFMLFASPGIDASEKNVVAKDVAFVLDTSGSMAGPKIEQARKALLFCVRNLNEKDRFEVLRFSTDTEPLFHELRPASRENVSKAESFIEGLKALNGTAIDDALRQALELRAENSERPFVVIFLTDGLPTVGETRPEKILANVHERARNTRIFCFGIGSDVNTHLLDKIAEDTRAFSTYVTPSEDIEVKVSTFYSKIRDPLLANVKIDISGDVRFSKMYPSALPDLFKGEQLIVAGRYKSNGKATVTLKGTVNGEPKSFTQKIEFPERDSDYEFIPRLWATRRVGALLDQIRLNGENAELRDEVTELARKYGIVTPYTAYLIMEDEDRRAVPVHAQTMPDAAKMPVLRAEVRERYLNMSKEKSGDRAVAVSQANQDLSSAVNSEAALNYSNSRGLGGAYAPTTPAPAGAFNRMAGRPFAASAAPVAANLMGAIQQQNSRFVAGRAFYQNNLQQWIDTQVQKQTNAPIRRIQFNSDDYFKFAAANKDLSPILSLGADVEFVHNNQRIQITR